ncbi:divalent-cation tolerance protein CutA [Patescibacteria group bacterium]|nr:MAG: divalent-cation tolerance protein CutA [Patescibacteria group bacterium]
MADAASVLYLTCATKQEAEVIARALLDRRLIACASATQVESWFLWDGETETSHETLLIMKSRQGLFDDVNTVVADLHSYNTYVLEEVLVNTLSEGASAWLHKMLKK